MELGEPEALGVLDDHDGGVRHIDADFNHCGGDEYLHFVALEASHRLLLGSGRHASVDEGDLIAEDLLELGEPILGRDDVEHLALLDERRDPEGLRAFLDPRFEPGDDAIVLGDGEHGRVNLLATGGFLAQHARRHVAEMGEHETSRDRRGRHHQEVGVLALVAQRQPLFDAEAMLLVHDREPEIVELDLRLEQRMRADNNGDRAISDPC